MSQTRIICEGCGNTQVFCTCEQTERHKEKLQSETKDAPASELQRLVIPTLKPCEKALVEWGRREGHITNWCWNDNFMNWINKYYPQFSGNDGYKKALRAFRYRANKLVELGYFKPCERKGIGVGGYSDFGITTQSHWEYKGGV